MFSRVAAFFSASAEEPEVQQEPQVSEKEQPLIASPLVTEVGLNSS